MSDTDKLILSGPAQQIVIKTYTGSQDRAHQLFQEDASRLAAVGYFPTSQSWAPGAYGCGSFLGALLLCVVLIGIVIFIYMLLVKPPGTLSVTYQFRGVATNTNKREIVREKVCPKCAETVKEAAIVCRFCGHSFEVPQQ